MCFQITDEVLERSGFVETLADVRNHFFVVLSSEQFSHRFPVDAFRFCANAAPFACAPAAVISVRKGNLMRFVGRDLHCHLREPAGSVFSVYDARPRSLVANLLGVGVHFVEQYDARDDHSTAEQVYQLLRKWRIVIDEVVECVAVLAQFLRQQILVLLVCQADVVVFSFLKRFFVDVVIDGRELLRCVIPNSTDDVCSVRN